MPLSVFLKLFIVCYSAESIASDLLKDLCKLKAQVGFFDLFIAEQFFCCI
jgi:hypothetical protein